MQPGRKSLPLSHDPKKLNTFNCHNVNKAHYVVEEEPKDDCSKYDGLLHKNRAVCCNKKCKKCGGVQGNCGKLTDEEGKRLGSSQCCGWKIENTGITCGTDGSNAPCKLPTPSKK